MKVRQRRNYKHSLETLEKMRQARLALIAQGKMIGPTHPSWKHGRFFSSHGYAKVWVGKQNLNADSDGYVYEHTLQLQKYLCRALTKDETAHHLNKIRDDNRIGKGGNLQLMSKNEHHIYHARRQKSQIKDLSKRDIIAWRQRWRWLIDN